MDICFKVHGYSEWFIELKKKNKGKTTIAAVSQTHDTLLEPAKTKQDDWNKGMFNMLQLQQEILSYMKS